MKYLTTFLLTLPLTAQQDTPVFRTETTLATVHFHVVQGKKYVDNLKAGDLVLLEDGKPRKITFFEGGPNSRRTVPLELILMFDTSGSVVQPGLLDMVTYRKRLLDGQDNVRIAVYGFDSVVRKYTKPTRDAELLAGVFAKLSDFRANRNRGVPRIPLTLPPGRKKAMGGTWIYEAVNAVMEDAIKTPGNPTRMLVVISDGLPTTDAKPEDSVPLAKEHDIHIYPVVLGHWKLAERMQRRQANQHVNRKGMVAPQGQAAANDEMKERDMLNFASLGELTGGRSFDPRELNTETVEVILRFLQGQMLYEYVAGFSPESSNGEPKKHKIEVKLARRDLGKITGGSRTLVH